MYLTRFLGGVLAIIGAWTISTVFAIDLVAVCAFLAFILIVDSMMVKYLTAVYMRMVIEDITRTSLPKEKEKQHDDSSSDQ